jgi:hypothetical protein
VLELIATYMSHGVRRDVTACVCTRRRAKASSGFWPWRRTA